MFVWCVGRVATSVSNGLGVYDGLSNMLGQVVFWAVPYWIGRAYFTDIEGIRDLAKGIVIGGLLYVPFVLWEIRFSPQLHTDFYGFLPVSFKMTVRYGGFRPIVFMQSGLMVAMWLTAATVVCAWLGSTGAVKRIVGIPTRVLVVPLALTTVLCKALGAITLMLVGLGILVAARRLKLALPLVALIAIAGGYPVLRGTETLTSERILATAGLVYDDLRLQSLSVRLRSEDMYMEKVSERPWLGWGGWGRSEVLVEREARSIPDGLWIAALSRNGWLAVAALIAMYLMSPLSWVMRFRATQWTQPGLVPVGALISVIVLYWVDCLSNAMINLVLVLAMGAVNSWFSRRRTVAVQVEPAAGVAEGHAAPPLSAALGRALTSRRGSQRFQGPPRQ
jgi:hypothetical protein